MASTGLSMGLVPQPAKNFVWADGALDNLNYIHGRLLNIFLIVSVFRSQNGQKCVCGKGFVADPAEGAYSAPQNPSWTKGRGGKRRAGTIVEGISLFWINLTFRL